MRPKGTDSPGMQSLIWADSTALSARPGSPRRPGSSIPPDDRADRRELMARSLAYLFAAGSIITLALFAVLPHPEAKTAGMLITAGLALIVAVAIEVTAELLPDRAFPWLVALGSALIAAAVYFRGSPITVHSLFFCW